jgi:hypothetical protein
MPAHRPAATAALATAVGLLTALGVTGCGGSSGVTPTAGASPASGASADPSAEAAASASASSVAAGLAVPGIPDPCALLPATQIITVAHLPSDSRSGAVASATGGRSCAYDPGHPSQATVSLTPVSKAGFDAFRQSAQGTITDLPGIGQEAYKSSQTPGVVDVYKNGFDLNVYVIHADTADSASADAKALAQLLAAKL